MLASHQLITIGSNRSVPATSVVAVVGNNPEGVTALKRLIDEEWTPEKLAEVIPPNDKNNRSLVLLSGNIILGSNFGVKRIQDEVNRACSPTMVYYLNIMKHHTQDAIDVAVLACYKKLKRPDQKLIVVPVRGVENGTDPTHVEYAHF